MQASTLLAMREAVATAIAGILGSQSHAERRDERWHRVRAIADVASASPRTFMVRCMASVVDETGLYGDGMAAASLVQVWTSYAGLPDDDDGPMIDEDGRQIYCRLSAILDPTTPGLIAFQPQGWVYEDEAPGKVWGYHALLMTFLQSDDA